MKQFLVFAFMLCVGFAHGQKLKVEDGNFKFLKGQKSFNVEFVYDNMKLFKDNKTNEEYMEERAADLENKTKGKGEAWKKKWMGSREFIYEPKFMELMNRYLGEKQGVELSQGNEDAKYTLVVETVWVYPGWNAAVMRQPAKVSTNLKFVETANRDKVVLEVSSKHAPGDSYGGTFSNEDRIGEGYAKTGKSLAKLLLKKGY